MLIGGLQKLTLLDFPKKIACIVFTSGCNFRCPYCHNSGLVTKITDSFLPEEEILNFLKKRQGLLDGVVITGGEPLLQKDIIPFIKKIKDLGFLVKLDTNGSYPEVLKSLVEENLLDYVAVDIKNTKELYNKTCGLVEGRIINGLPSIDFTKIDATIKFLLSDKVDYEFRTTVVKELHSKESLLALSNWVGKAKRHYLQNFKDSDSVIKTGFHSYTDDELKAIYKSIAPKFNNLQLRGI
jgi:pyruvate formate lyase activating enzyme